MEKIQLSSQLLQVDLTKDEAKIIDECIPVKRYKKGDILLEEGTVAHECYYCIKGIVREYYIIDGEERTTQFFIEGDSNYHSEHRSITSCPTPDCNATPDENFILNQIRISIHILN